MESKLSRSDAESYLALPGLGEHLSAADLSKLRALLPLIAPSGEIVLAAALGALFPGQPRTTALAYLRQLRSRLRQGAAAAGVDLALHVGGGTRTAPEDRTCWFTGPSRAVERISAFSEAGTALRDLGREPIPLQARLLRGEGIESEDSRRLVRVFISYARENRRFKENLVQLLRARLANARDFRFKIWDDPKILPGEGWADEIRSEIEACDLGLLLFSHEFLASDFIRLHELPYFVSTEASKKPPKLSVPVGLAHVDLDDKRFRLHGIEARQVFRFKDRFFAESRDKSRFVTELVRQLVDFVEKHLPSAADAEAIAPPSSASSPPSDSEEDLASRIEERLRPGAYGVGGDSKLFVPTRALKARLDKETTGEKPTTSGEQVDSLEFLLAWATDPSEPPFCALLGEYGMGKTTTCEAFTRRLLEARDTDPAVPAPIYLDLRHVGDHARKNPELEEILRLVSAKTHATGRPGAEAPSAAEIMELVQSGKAVAIFDGLDEVLVHLTAPQGQSFTRELWRILPPRRLPPRKNEEGGVVKKPVEATPPPPSGKLLISCRTHYFRTLREERNHFLGQDREAISPSDYRALVLLPFTIEQIEEYLGKNLPGQDVETLLALIRSVHNLEELAERPYTLKLIAEHIPKLEQWKLEGRKVTGVILYREMVASWLERDEGKHTLTKEHKLRLMERFAAELWTSGKRTWSAEDVEQWLMDFLDSNPRVRSHYEGKDRELLKEDLRTATFLIRDGEDGFRFAHTSLQEFFLAAHLHRALRERRFEAWQIPKPSLETLDFLGQLMAEKDKSDALTGFRELRGAYRSQASELMLAYALRAKEKGHPAPALAGFRLDGAQLSGWVIYSPDGSPPLDFQGASFRGADMKGAKVYQINANDSDFSGADLSWAEICSGAIRGARFEETNITGTIFRDLNLGGTYFSGSRIYRTQWLHCDLTQVSGLVSTSGLFANCKPSSWNTKFGREAARLHVFQGHAMDVLSCAFSPDGTIIASSGTDGTVRLWDTRSGELMRQALGHTLPVSCCTFSPDGTALASAGEDGTIRLWDILSGEPIRSIQDQKGKVRSCAYSPRGSMLASAGDDGAVRLWDPGSGRLLRSIHGHTGDVFACSFSPDGAILASTGRDGSVRLWNPDSGELLRHLHGHERSVLSCGFSPDGAVLASAGQDGTVRLWDMCSGELLRSLQSQEGSVRNCNFSPDGTVLATAGSIGIVKLWDANSGEPLRSIRHRGAWSCAFSPDGGSLASTGEDGAIGLWSVHSGNLLFWLRSKAEALFSCVFSPDGASLAFSGEGGSLSAWDVRSGKPQFSFRHFGKFLFCGFSPDGISLAAAEIGRVGFWDSHSGAPLRSLQRQTEGMSTCAFSPNGSSVTYHERDGTIQLLDTHSGEIIRSFRGHEGWVRFSSFSPDRNTLASVGNDGTVRLWDVRTGEPLFLLQDHKGWVRSCAFSSDGATLASAGDDGIVRLWDTHCGKLLRSLCGHKGRIICCNFSPGGNLLGTAGDDGTIRLWDTSAGECIRSLHGHEGGVLSCAFSPSGGSLASSGTDASLRLWDIATGKETSRIQYFWYAQMALFGPNMELTYASPGAWRWLGWLAPDPETGVITRYPAEIFGPLPGGRESEGSASGNRHRWHEPHHYGI